MYICICKSVSEKRLQRAVDSGDVISLRDLTRSLGVGTCCGKCIPAAKAALGAALSAQSHRQMIATASVGLADFSPPPALT